MDTEDELSVVKWALRRAVDRLSEDARKEILKILSDNGMTYDETGHLTLNEPVLKAAREGLLAAAAVVEPRSPAYREVVKALEAVNGVLESGAK